MAHSLRASSPPADSGSGSLHKYVSLNSVAALLAVAAVLYGIARLTVAAVVYLGLRAAVAPSASSLSGALAGLAVAMRDAYCVILVAVPVFVGALFLGRRG